jgi:hypothetical protein
MNSDDTTKAEESLQKLGARLRASIVNRPLSEAQRKAVREAVKRQPSPEVQQGNADDPSIDSQTKRSQEKERGPELGY